MDVLQAWVDDYNERAGPSIELQSGAKQEAHSCV